MKNKRITDKNIDFGQWYTDIIIHANLATYSNIKGMIIYEPLSYAIWENVSSVFNQMIKSSGHSNVYMPLLIPEQSLNKEKELIEGFAPEVAWVTFGGEKLLEERLCIRPTSETLFSEYFSKKVKSYRDLPIKYNQWCSVIRWEKETKPFLRGREFLWQEGHTVHSSKEEAEEETKLILSYYQNIFENYLAIPVITGKKTDSEKFAGAEYTLSVEALMYNGICLQSATSHFFGQRFSKAYNISYADNAGNPQFAYQTSWGFTTRIIGALIMVHGDNYGLVLPPKIAPIQVMIVPIKHTDDIINFSELLYEKFLGEDIRVAIDSSKKSAGFRFAESEVRGIPLRIEIGINDLENNEMTIVRRDNLRKEKISLDSEYIQYIKNTLVDIQNNLYNQALERNKNLTFKCTSITEIKDIVKNQSALIEADWCGNKECEKIIKEEIGIKARCIVEDYKSNTKKLCVRCSEKAKHKVLWGFQY